MPILTWPTKATRAGCLIWTYDKADKAGDVSTAVACRLTKKAKHYGRLPSPLVVAVNVMGDPFLDTNDLSELLWGARKTVNQGHTPSPRQTASSVWFGRDYKPRKQTLAAVWAFRNIAPWHVAHAYNNVFVNPTLASHLFPSVMRQFRYTMLQSGRIVQCNETHDLEHHIGPDYSPEC